MLATGRYANGDHWSYDTLIQDPNEDSPTVYLTNKVETVLKYCLLLRAELILNQKISSKIHFVICMELERCNILQAVDAWQTNLELWEADRKATTRCNHSIFKMSET
ncbi:hypothetical protein Tco_1195230 [Tanacetum coccineum]